ncbi:MAG: ATPase, T2SS/T4P/T4SS family [Patescibacteria group bacterium]|nr:ATPase, T2SS/T4P/T4SS family [Patescibacteria group bacterium]
MQSIREKVKEQLSLSSDVRVIRAIDKIFNFAIGCEAEEILFEPRAKDLAVNFMADGELKNTLLLPKKAEQAVIAGVKAKAGLNYPADNSAGGRKFKKDFLGYKIIFSLCVRSGSAGEKITVNLAKEKFQLFGLGQLGLNAKALEIVKKNLLNRQGLTAVIGDFNSGRTATLYSFINFLKHPELNIATVEKDVACDLPEINQSRLSKLDGFSAKNAINALKRQDADVIMIGDINDRETAEAAFNLAQSGHFILAGIYSRDIVVALNFLQEAGVTLSSFSANAKMAITQRLADKNCPFCLTKQKIGRESRRRLEEKLSLRKLLSRLMRDKIISNRINKPEDLIFYKSAGCPRCHNSGVAGKIGIFEVLEITPEVKNIIKTGHFSSLRREPEKQGGYSLAEDALIKALGGLISLEAVIKAAE